MKPQIPHEIIDEEPVLVCPDCKVSLEEDWLRRHFGNDRDPENWRLVGLVCPKCYRLFEIAEAVIDMDDVPF